MPRRESKVINGLACELEQCPPRLNLKTFAGLVRQLGPGPARALTDPKELARIMKMEHTRAAKLVLLHTLQSCEHLEPEELGKIADSLLVGRLVIGKIGIDSTAMLDTQVPDFFTYLRLLRWALELNFLPTSAGSATSDGSASPATSAGPGSDEAPGQ